MRTLKRLASSLAALLLLLPAMAHAAPAGYYSTWSYRAIISSLDGGTYFGTGTQQVIWGEPLAGGVTVTPGSISSRTPLTQLVFNMNYRNGAVAADSAPIGGTLLLSVRQFDCDPTGFCSLNLSGYIDETHRFTIINTLNLGDPIGDSDSFRIAGKSAWIREEATGQFSLVAKPRYSKSAMKVGGAAEIIQPTGWDIVDVFPLDDNVFVTDGEVPVMDRVALEPVVDPQNDEPTVNPKSNGLIKVAIYGSDARPVSTLNAASFRLGSSGKESSKIRTRDIDGDGVLDLELDFHTQGTGIACGDSVVNVDGLSNSNLSAAGYAAIITIGCPAN